MNPRAWISFRRRTKRGFTLLEMMVTLAIFMLLATAVFGIIVETLRSTSTLQDNQGHRDQMVALNAFLKKKIEGLGPESFLVSYRRGNDEGLAQNGIAFGRVSDVIVIDAKPQVNGYYLIRLGRAKIEGGSSLNGGIVGFKLPPGVLSDDGEGVEWTSLLRDVRAVGWKFRETGSDQWVNVHASPSPEPNLVELTVQLAGDLQPTTMDFWIPHISAVPLSLAKSPAIIPTNGANSATGANPVNGMNPANGLNPVNGASPMNGVSPVNRANPGNVPEYVPGAPPVNNGNPAHY